MGFSVQVRSQVDETPSFSSIQALGLSPASIERLRGVLRVWVMTLGGLPAGPATARLASDTRLLASARNLQLECGVPE